MRPPKAGMGRPKGAQNKATREIKEAFANLLTDPDYVAALKVRLRRGTAQAVEVLGYHYAYGKPKETIAHEGLAAVKSLTDEALVREVAAIAAKLKR